MVEVYKIIHDIDIIDKVFHTDYIHVHERTVLKIIWYKQYFICINWQFKYNNQVKTCIGE